MAYNVATNTWTFRKPMPFRLPVVNDVFDTHNSPSAAVINGKIYVPISLGESSTSLVPTRRRSTCTTPRRIPGPGSVTSQLPHPLAVPNLKRYAAGNGVTGVINGKLYFVSGCFEDHGEYGLEEVCNPLFYRYNPATDWWVRLPAPCPCRGVELEVHPSAASSPGGSM